jgi:hypothetical protein
MNGGGAEPAAGGGGERLVAVGGQVVEDERVDALIDEALAEAADQVVHQHVADLAPAARRVEALLQADLVATFELDGGEALVGHRAQVVERGDGRRLLGDHRVEVLRQLTHRRLDGGVGGLRCALVGGGPGLFAGLLDVDVGALGLLTLAEGVLGLRAAAGVPLGGGRHHPEGLLGLGPEPAAGPLVVEALHHLAAQAIPIHRGLPDVAQLAVGGGGAHGAERGLGVLLVIDRVAQRLERGEIADLGEGLVDAPLVVIQAAIFVGAGGAIGAISADLHGLPVHAEAVGHLLDRAHACAPVARVGGEVSGGQADLRGGRGATGGEAPRPRRRFVLRQQPGVRSRGGGQAGLRDVHELVGEQGRAFPPARVEGTIEPDLIAPPQAAAAARQRRVGELHAHRAVVEAERAGDLVEQHAGPLARRRVRAAHAGVPRRLGHQGCQQLRPPPPAGRGWWCHPAARRPRARAGPRPASSPAAPTRRRASRGRAARAGRGTTTPSRPAAARRGWPAARRRPPPPGCGRADHGGRGGAPAGSR